MNKEIEDFSNAISQLDLTYIYNTENTFFFHGAFSGRDLILGRKIRINKLKLKPCKAYLLTVKNEIRNQQ